MTSDKRTCKRCNETKPSAEFRKYHPVCHVCARKADREYYAANRERVLAQKSAYREAHPDQERQTRERSEAKHRKPPKPRHKMSEQEYKESRKAISRRYRAKPSFKAERRAYIEANRESINETNRLARRQWLKDPLNRLGCQIRSYVATVVGRCGVKKSDKTIKLLGCSMNELKAHIETLFYRDMTWDMYGNGPGTFQIDHIKAVGLFDLSDPEQQHQCFHYTNLQPLWFEDHVKKTVQDILLIKASKTTTQS